MSSGVMSVYEKLRLHTTNELFVLEPVSSSANVIVIDRTLHTIQTKNIKDIESQIFSANVRDVHGLLGVVRLLAGPYLVVITEKKFVGKLQLGSDIWKATELEMISFSRSMLHLSNEQLQDERAYSAMLNSMLSSGAFYFSYTFDLTHTFQRLYTADSSFFGKALHERADVRFYWNRYLHEPFASIRECKNFLLPVIHGFVSINSCRIKNKSFDFVLISRRSVFRSGTRYNVRGIDETGAVANYVETEQIVHHEGQYRSYVQVRGSIPLFWTQRANIKYKPSIIVEDADHLSAMKLHVNEQQKLYGQRQVLINLVDHKGGELKLKDGYTHHVQMLGDPQVRLINFDFHKKCSKMRWDRLSELLDDIMLDLEKQSYFSLDRNNAIKSLQSGVFRTNCVDCLDRTNVVQSMIARLVLKHQFVDLGILSPSDDVGKQDSFELRFKNVWADNADAVSVQYSGTGALKTDFTRTGKRTIGGALQDGYNSLMRYYKNNFTDGFRQDGVALFLGNYVVNRDSESPFRSGSKRFRMLPLIAVVIFAMLILSVLFPTTDDSVLHFAYILFWALAFVVTFRTIITYGSDFVDHPRLAAIRVMHKII